MEQYKNKIIKFYKEHKRMPVYTEIMKLLGFKSKNAVFKLVEKLVDAGVLDKDSKGRLIPNKLQGEVPLLGLVEAGFPSPAEEELIDTMSLDEMLIKNREATYVLRVKGESMIDAGIVEGDMVLVERGKIPKVGDIVIARVDGEYTIKYYEMKEGKPYLMPANKNFEPIYPESDLEIEAVVKAVIRQY